MLMRRPGGEMRPGRALWLYTRPFLTPALNLRVTVPMAQPDSFAQSFAPCSVWFLSTGGLQLLAFFVDPAPWVVEFPFPPPPAGPPVPLPVEPGVLERAVSR